MEMTRRDLLKKSGKFILLTSAAAVAWEFVLAGKAEAAPNYTMTEHWWAMIIDPDKVHRMRQLRARLRSGERRPEGYFRTWVERYHVEDWRPRSIPQVDSPNGGNDGFPRARTGRRTRTSSCPRCATTVRIRPAFRCARWARPSSRPTASCWSIRTIAWAAAIASRPARMVAASSIRRNNTADKCTLCYHRITKGLTTACCEACPTGARQLADLKNPNDPIHEFLQNAQRAGAKAANGDGRQGVLQRPRRFGAIRSKCMHALFPGRRLHVSRTKWSCNGAS